MANLKVQQAELKVTESHFKNQQSFAELAFSFSLSTSIVVSSFIFAVIMGLLGGFLPAKRAPGKILSMHCVPDSHSVDQAVAPPQLDPAPAVQP